MKLSYAWLNEFVDLKDISPEDLKDQLTMKAFEVEEIETIGLTGPVVVGEILEINKHPDADKIRVTQMRVAENGEPTQIVCGAQNIEVGQLVPVCLPGAVVINRKTGEGLPIKQSEIRGVTSNGMLASASELGIATSDVDGIHVLKKPGESSDLKLGQNALELLNLASDQVFHVGTRSNRGDALCVKGMAREVCALTSRKMKESKTKNEQVAKVFGQTSNSNNSNSDFSVKIESDAAEDCKYFSIVVIKDLKVQPSPTWLANRLTAMGLRPVNNIVDITNYVMLELGQPLHAYDLDKLPSKSIVVRKARDGEKMLCIDGKERQATNEVLAIASGEVPVGYAGIMGGKDSEISDGTKNIALEAAWFKPARVRRGSRLLGLSSDSSLRFERGVDLASVNPALERACDLIIDICGTEKTAQALEPPFTAGSDKVENQNKISVRMERVKKLLEITLESNRAAALLNPLGFVTTVKDAQTLEVISPSYREKDVQREIDVIEEIARLYGYDNIPVSSPTSTASPIPRDFLLHDLKNKLMGQGFSEVWISSLRGENDFAGHSPEELKSVVKVLNPLSSDHQAMRQSLLPGLLEVINYNQSRGERSVWMFEQGRGYKVVDGKPQEYTLLSGIMTGNLLKHVSHGGIENNTSIDFFMLKGIVENVLEAAKVSLDKIMFLPLGSDDFYKEYLHPHKSTRLSFVTKQIMGILGEVHPRTAAKYDLKDSAYAFELFVDVVKSASEKMNFQEPVLNPSVMRDLTVDVENSIEQDKVYKSMMQVGKREGMSCDLVSTYQLSDGQKSLSYRLTFRQKEALSGEAVDTIVQKVREALSKRVNARFRG